MAWLKKKKKSRGAHNFEFFLRFYVKDSVDSSLECLGALGAPWMYALRLSISMPTKSLSLRYLLMCALTFAIKPGRRMCDLGSSERATVRSD